MRVAIAAVAAVALVAGVAPANGLTATTTESALAAALEDERRSEATYRAVLERFGEVRPFVNIVQAEQCHAGQLVPLFETRGLEPPVNAWSGAEIDVAGTVTEACREAAELERLNVAMYDELLAAVDDPDVQAVFTRLRQASLAHHLPAFERCAEGRPGRGAGPGSGGGRRGGCCGACAATGTDTN